jgi:hypothetical protein
MATTWDPSNKSSTQALSGGNLVATSTGEGTVVATRVLTSLLSYFEVTIITLTGTMAVGLVNRSYSPGTSALLGVTANEMGFRSTGAVEINGVTVATIQTFAASSVIGVAVNAQLGLVWFTTNGTTWNNDVIANQNPVGSVGGISLASMTGGSTLPAAGGSLTGAVLAGVFSTGSFAYTPPTGYVSVDGCGATARNSEVGNTATYSTVGSVASYPATTTIAAKASLLGMGHGTALFQGPATSVSGTITEGTTPVAKTVRAYDTKTGVLLGSVVSNPSTGAFSIAALGRTAVDVVAKDPTTYQAQIYDNVTPA